MNVKYINPFVEATQMVFKEFVGIEIRPRRAFVFTPGNSTIHYDISGIIGLAGEVLGLIIISFPKLVALKTVSRIINTEIKIFDNTVVDTIGELINIIAGNSKKGMEDIRIVISLPSIVKGYNHQLGWVSGIPVICIPFETDSGEFYIFVSLKDLLL